jgi:hypothetical protein
MNFPSASNAALETGAIAYDKNPGNPTAFSFFDRFPGQVRVVSGHRTR